MKIRILILCGLFLCSFNTNTLAQVSFLTTWKTDNPGTSCASCITIPTVGGGYSYNVDWENDGTIDDFGVSGNITHDYGTAGTYQVAITSNFPRIYFNNGGDKNKILAVNQWGVNNWSSMERAFYGCSNLEILATDAPNLSNCFRFPLIFAFASSVNGGLENWNTSNINNMASAFSGASSFNGDISGWDVSNVSNLAAMFRATPFNQDISGWNTSSAMHFIQMFENNSAFNQDISGWNVANTSSLERMFSGASSFNQDINAWDVSGVSNMFRMFYNASAFNQDLSLWNTGSVTNMGQMFWNATAFDQNLVTWDVTNVTSMSFMFLNVTLSTANYDATLIGWDAQNLNSNVQFHGGNSLYCNGEAARDNMINNDSWSIADGGLDPLCNLAIPSCSNLNSPLNGSNNVLITSSLNWNAITDADGYRISIGTTSGGTDILNDMDLGNVTVYNPPSNLPCASTIFVTIIPYNTIGDAIGCVEESFATESVTAFAGPDVTICENDSANLSGSGGTTYSWSPSTGLDDPSSATPEAIPAVTTTYTLTVSNANGCTDTDEVTVNVNALPNPSISGNLSVCIGESTTLDAGTFSTYSWSNGATTQTISVSPVVATSYSVTVTDANGCIDDDMVTVNVNPLPTPSIAGSTVLCSGESKILDAGLYSAYQWSTGATTQTVSVNPTITTIYSVTVTDANGCMNDATHTLTVTPTPTVMASATPNSICIGGSSNIQATGSGGSFPYTYAWDNGNTGSSFTVTPTSTATYMVTITDALGCTDTDMVTVTVNPLPTPSITGNLAICIGDITTLDAGNFSSYAWSNGATTQTISVNPTTATSYTVSVTDINGCMNTDMVSIIVNSLDVTPTPIATTCGQNDGEVSFTINQGTAPVSYSSGGTPVTGFTGLAAGNYTWDAVDANGCMFTTNFTIGSSIALTINTTPVSTFCDGNNGSVTGTMITGNGSATYTLNGNVNNTGVFTGLAPGTYTMTATDQLFCTASSTFTINGSAPLQISTVVTPTFCNEDNGSITATLNSGTSPVNYTIAGQGTNTSGIFTDLAPGTYVLNAVDAVGCQATETFTINPSDPLDINTVIVSTTCELDNGSVSATLMSGTTPVTFTIAGQGSNTTGQFIDLAPGTYTMNAVDAAGCQASVTFDIDDSTLPLFDMEVVRTSCGDVNGSIQLTPDVNTGLAPYEFNIGNGWTTDYVFDNLLPDNYTVTIRDADGCMTSQSTTILDSEQLVFINHIDHADCNNITGIITLIALEGTGPFLYSISNEFMYRQNDFGIFSFVEAGQYTATVIGEDGCVVTQKLNVENDPGVSLDVEVTHPACGETDGSLQFNLGKTGTAPYQIFVDGALVEDSLYYDYLISDMANGDYKVEVFDYYGCNDYAEITINDGNSIVEDLVINHIDCDGSLGSISTTIGDPGNYTFTLGGETNTDGSFTDLEAGRYTYTATDSMGCDYTSEIEILDDSFTDVRVLVINDDCENLSNIKIIPENGNGPYRYFVNGKQYFENGASDLPSGFYTVEVIDANGCSHIQEIKVEGESKLTYSILKCRKSKFGQPGFLVVQAIGGEGPYRYKLDEYTSKKGLFVNLYKDTYTLTITDSRGCSSTFEVNLCGDDTSNKSLPSLRSINDFINISVYPNPGDNILNINHGSTLDESKIEIYSSTGQLIKQISITSASDITKINTQEWSKGIYFIKIGSTRMIKWFKV